MSPLDIKRRLAETLSRAGPLATGMATGMATDLATDLATPLRQAQLSPLSGIILAGLLATAVGAGLFAAYAILRPAGPDATITAPDWTPPTLAVVELDAPKPADADVETLSRPIFSKSRRPTPKAAKPSTPTETTAIPAATGLSINAIIRNKKASQAYFVSPDAPEGAWKKVGDTVDSWTVKSIERYEVILANGGQTAKVQLYTETPQQPGSAMPNPFERPQQ